MPLFCWTVNTPKDSGPTRYIVIADTVSAARIFVIREPLVQAHHIPAITKEHPTVLFERELLKI